VLFARRRKELKSWKQFPSELTPFYKSDPLTWEQNGPYFKELQPETEEYEVLLDFLSLLDGKALPIIKAYAICSLDLWSSFAAHYRQLLTRKRNSPNIFFNQLWINKDKSGTRKWVYDKFTETTNAWNF